MFLEGLAFAFSFSFDTSCCECFCDNWTKQVLELINRLSCYEKNNKLLRNYKIIIIVREINTANLVNLNLKISPGTKEQRYCLRNKRILKHFKSTLAVFHVLSIMMVKCTLMKEQIKLKKKKKIKISHYKSFFESFVWAKTTSSTL